MNTPILDRDLTKQAPHSPRERIAGFAIADRTTDKCRASIAGTLGEYHYDCPLDNMLFSFKGINGGQFKTAVQAAKNYEDIGVWLQANGTKKTPAEIKEIVRQKLALVGLPDTGPKMPGELSGEKVAAHLAACTLVMEPGWPEFTFLK